MIITIKLERRSLALTAPLGAGAYAQQDSPDQCRVIFAMMRDGETGLDALMRARSTPSALTWYPVASRPEEQVATAYKGNDYVEYVFVKSAAGWTPATSVLANFLRVMQGAQSLPVSPPSELATTLDVASTLAKAKKGKT